MEPKRRHARKTMQSWVLLLALWISSTMPGSAIGAPIFVFNNGDFLIEIQDDTTIWVCVTADCQDPGFVAAFPSLALPAPSWSHFPVRIMETDLATVDDLPGGNGSVVVGGETFVQGPGPSSQYPITHLAVGFSGGDLSSCL